VPATTGNDGLGPLLWTALVGMLTAAGGFIWKRHETAHKEISARLRSLESTGYVTTDECRECHKNAGERMKAGDALFEHLGLVIKDWQAESRDQRRRGVARDAMIFKALADLTNDPAIISVQQRLQAQVDDDLVAPMKEK